MSFTVLFFKALFSSCILISQEKGLKLRMNCLIEIAETKVVWMKGEGCLNSNGAASFLSIYKIIFLVLGKFVDLLYIFHKNKLYLKIFVHAKLTSHV